MVMTAKRFVAGVAIGGLIAANPAIAAPQAEVAQSGDTANNTGSRIGDIVVTATKRPERLQDVPISVQAISGDLLKSNAVQNFENVEVPGVRVSRGGMADTITVRGIGSGQNLGFEQSAPMYIDGVYYGRARTQRLGFLDIERIEFLKGPQPTFLGKNAIAGAINIASKSPGSKFAGEVEASYEPVTDEYAGSAAVDVPIGPKFGLRAALKYRKSEGYLTNTVTGRREPAVEDFLGRLTLAGEIADGLKLTIKGYFGNNEDHGRNNQSTICEPNFRRDISSAAADPCLFDRFKASSGVIPEAAQAARPDLYTDDAGGSAFNRLRASGATMLLDYEFAGGVTLSSVTAYYKYKNYLFLDTDQGVANYSTATFNERYNQISQELRLASSKDGAFKWFLGAYVDKNNNDVISTADNDARNFIPFTPPAVPPQTNRPAPFVAARIGGSVSSSFENADSWALFGESSYTLGIVTGRVGLRYEQVRKDVDARTCATPLPYQSCAPLTGVANGQVTNSRKDTKFQPAFTLEARPAEDVLIYGSYKRGFKSGGFSGTDAGSFNPENVSAYEIGLKTKLFDRRVLFNLTAFKSDYKDLQVSSFDPNTSLFATTNAAAARSQGVEAELQWAIDSHLRLTGNVSYLEASYRNFTNAQCWAGQTATTGCNVATNTQNLSGVTTPYAPKWSGNIAMDYNREVVDGYTLRLGVDTYFTSSFATLTDINPRSFQGAFAKINGRIAIASASGWELAVVGRNLTDKLTSSFKNTIPGGFNSIASFTETPRTVTFQARFKF